MAATHGTYWKYLWQSRSSRYYYSLRYAMHYPRGLGPTLCVPMKSQAAQAPRKVCAVACAYLLFTSGFGMTAAAFSLLPQALSLALAVASGLCSPLQDDKLHLCLVPPLALVLLPALVTTTRHIATVCESVKVECPDSSGAFPGSPAFPEFPQLCHTNSLRVHYDSQPQSSP